MKAEVELWQERVADFSTKTDDGGTTQQKTAARQLERAWQALEQNWQKVRQAQNEEHWVKTHKDFASAKQEIAQLWSRVERQGKTGAN